MKVNYSKQSWEKVKNEIYPQEQVKNGFIIEHRIPRIFVNLHLLCFFQS